MTWFSLDVDLWVICRFTDYMSCLWDFVCLFIPVWVSLQKKIISVSLSYLHLLSSNGFPEVSKCPCWKEGILYKERKSVELADQILLFPGAFRIVFWSWSNWALCHHVGAWTVFNKAYIRLSSISWEVILVGSADQSLCASCHPYPCSVAALPRGIWSMCVYE